jgi:hypothetical protein
VRVDQIKARHRKKIDGAITRLRWKGDRLVPGRTGTGSEGSAALIELFDSLARL